MPRSKFNVDKDKEDRSYKGIVFDSKLEMRYYRDVLCSGLESGTIIRYELQKKYVLQDGYRRNGKAVLPITYIADFYIEYSDGSIAVIDIKGMPDNVAKIKRKMFWKKYPDIDYRWVTYAKKYGGWVDYDELQKLRKADKLKKKKEEEDNGTEE